MPDAANRAVDENALAGPNAGPLNQRLPHRQADHGQGGGFGEVQRRGLMRQQVGVGEHELRQRPAAALHAASAAVDGIADLEPRDRFTDGFNRAGDVAVKNGRQRRADFGNQPRADLRVNGVYTRGFHANEHVAPGEVRRGEIGRVKGLPARRSDR